MFYYIIDEMYSLICNYGQWTSKFNKKYSYMNLVVIIIVLVLSAFASTLLIA